MIYFIIIVTTAGGACPTGAAGHLEVGQAVPAVVDINNHQTTSQISPPVQNIKPDVGVLNWWLGMQRGTLR
jgi:hypothetical protein